MTFSFLVLQFELVDEADQDSDYGSDFGSDEEDEEKYLIAYLDTNYCSQWNKDI